MKAISLWQPWASLIAVGVKPYETRDWAPPAALIGQRIAIHAAKKVDPHAAQMAYELLRGRYDAAAGCDVAQRLRASFEGASPRLMARFGADLMPVGAVVCTARLRAAYQLGGRAIGTRSVAMSVANHMGSWIPAVAIDPFGDYTEGRWAWRLDDVITTPTPRPAVGRQKIFELPFGWNDD